MQPLVSDRIRVPFFQGAPSLTIGNVTVQDSANTAAFTLMLSQPSLQPITVQVNTNDGSAVAGIDYVGIANQVVTFAPGATTATVFVTLIPTASIKPFRAFTLTAGNMTIGGALAPSTLILGSGTGSIVDQNNSSNTFWSIGDFISTDGNAAAGPTTPFTFTIFTNQSFATDQTIHVTTAGFSSDYVPLVNFPVTLAANTTSTTVTVLVATGLNLTANATFTVTLSGPSAGVLGQKIVGTGIIVANQNAANPFDPTALSGQAINWQTVVPVSITQGNTIPAQQNVAIDVASLPTPGPPPVGSIPFVATSTIAINTIDPTQVLRDMTVTLNATFPDTSSLLVQLVAPNGGPTFDLSADEPGANFAGTVFDDQALNPISLRTTSIVQTITVDATGGTYTISFEGATTVPIPWNATATVVQNALQTLATIGSGGVTVVQSGKTYEADAFPVRFPNPPTVVTDAALLTGNTHSAKAAPIPQTLVPTSFRPDSPLSAAALPASQLNGIWTLVITNTSIVNFGTLFNWSLRLQTGFLSSHYTPNDPGFYGSLGNAMNQVQNGFTANLTRDPTDIFAIPTPLDGVPLSLSAPFLSPPYDKSTLPLIIPGPHQGQVAYSAANEVDTLNFGPGITGGTFTLTFPDDGTPMDTTSPISWSANTTILQANIQNALNALPNIGQGNVVVSNSANPTITFVNALSGPDADNDFGEDVGSDAALNFDATGLTGGTITSIGNTIIGAPLTNILQTVNFGPGVTGGTFTLTFNGCKRRILFVWSSNPSTLQANIQTALDRLIGPLHPET